MKNKIWVRFLALLLIVGGIVGIGVGFYFAFQFLPIHWIYLVLAAGIVALFSWTSIVGLRLWRNESRGWKWAIILYASQIPILTVPGLRYEWYTGFTLKLAGGNVASGFSAGMGANADFYLDTRITELVYGINLFALGAFVLLLRARSNLALNKDAPKDGAPVSY